MLPTMASPGTPAPKVRRRDASSLPLRCPFEACPSASVGSPGWLTEDALVAHVNSIHLSQPGTTLPVGADTSFRPCPRCGLVTSRRGCLACAGRRGSPIPPAPAVRNLTPHPNSADSALPDLADVLSTHVEVLEHIPKGVRVLWATVLAEALTEFSTYPSQASLCRLFLLPKCVLRPIGRGGARAKAQTFNTLTTRLRRCLDGEWTALWIEVREAADALRKKRASKSTSEDSGKTAQQAARRVVRLLAKKGLSKAARELSSDGLHELSSAKLERLKQLHPPSEPPGVPPNSEACSWSGFNEEEEDLELLLKLVRDFPDSSAAGPSQLAPTHFKEAVFCGSDVAQGACVDALRLFTNKCASGSLPTELAEFLTCANLVPLRKKDNGVRPIACGEVLCRFVEVAILQKVLPEVADHLLPLQVGVNLRDAATHVAQACSQALPLVAGCHGFGLLQIDMANAFNTVSREAILAETLTVAPALHPWAVWSLRSQGLLFCQGEVLRSQSGVRQGGPLSPLLFALALHRVVRPLAERLKREPLGWSL